MQELEERLREDLFRIGLEVDFKLSLRAYSKSYFGRYDPNTNTIIVYVNKTPQGVRYSYKEILLTTIHEAIHCKQWNDPEFVRIKGVMHDVEFKKLYARYSDRAKARILLREVENNVEFPKKSFRQVYDLACVCC